MSPSHNLFGWSDGVWQTLDQFGILLGDFMLTSTLILGIVGFMRRNDIRRWLTRNRFPEVGGTPENTHWEGLVFTVSKTETPRWVLEKVRPKHAAFVASRESFPVAEELAQFARGLGIEVHGPLSIADPNEPAESRQATSLLLSALKSAGCTSVAVDVTGGKVPMSLGAFMAAEETGAASLYVAADFGAGLKQPDMRTARLLCVSRPRD